VCRIEVIWNSWYASIAKLSPQVRRSACSLA
jgi:hypothetical protein